MSDKELKKHLNKNPNYGFKLLVDEYGTLVKVICSNLLYGLRQEDVDDAISECFVEIWKSISKLISASNIKAYIIGITKNCAKDKLNKLKKDMSYITDFEEDIGINVDMEGEISKKINETIVKNVILEMPEFEREIFIRRYYYCERVKSIALGLNCTEKKVENILFRYKEKLKTALIERGIII